MYTLLPRLRIRLKVSRPRYTKADPRPGRLGKRELGERLAEAGLTVGQEIVWGDEMRPGLISRECRVWAPRGVAVSQAVPIHRQYTYVAVALESMTGYLS